MTHLHSASLWCGRRVPLKCRHNLKKSTYMTIVPCRHDMSPEIHILQECERVDDALILTTFLSW